MSLILIVDDHPEFLSVQRQLLQDAGHTVVTASDGFKALAAVDADTYDLVITDIIMPGKEGIETIMELRRRHPLLKVIAMSGGGRMGAFSYLEIAEKLGALATLEKPFNQAQLLETVETVLNA